MGELVSIATAILLKNYLTNIGYKRITNKKIFCGNIFFLLKYWQAPGFIFFFQKIK